MRKLLLLILSVVPFSVAAQSYPPIQMPNNFNPASVALDQYGGRMDIPCTPAASGNFKLVKIVNRWFFCTPAGHAYISFNVSTSPQWGAQCTSNNNSVVATRYNTNRNYWSDAAFKRLFAWGFNGTGPNSSNTQAGSTQSGINWPNNTQPISVPAMTEIKPAQEALVNRYGYLDQPLKDTQMGLDDTIYVKWLGDADTDFFDSRLSTEATDTIAVSGISGAQPYILAVLTDDSDWCFATCDKGPDLAGPSGTQNSSGGNPDISWMMLITSPRQSATATHVLGPGPSFVYNDTEVYAKMQATNPSTTCSITNPCSLRDYLWQKYVGSISSLNTAWGTNYSTFDSSGTQVNKEAIATGNGATSTYSYTVLSTPVSPESIQIFYKPAVGSAVDISGDCPNFAKHCVSSSGLGEFVGPPNWNWGSAQQGSAHPIVPTGMLITDSNGCIEQATVGGQESGTQPTWPAGTTCSPGLTVTDNQITWTSIGPGLLTTSSVTYATSALTLNFSANVPSGAAISVSYISCGWHTSCGTGLMDEWGKSTAAEPASGPCASQNSSCWVGTNNICLTPPIAAYAIWTSCVAGLDGLPNANATLASDLEAWIPIYMARYYKTMRTDLTAGNVTAPYAGFDFTGDWGMAARPGTYQGEVPYVDMIFAVAPSGSLSFQHTVSSNGTGGIPNGLTQEAYLAAKYNFITQYAGDIPFGYQYQDFTEFDSSEYCFSATTFNQSDRGMDYYRTVNWLMQQPSFNGDYQSVLFNWWVYQDFQSANQGLVTVMDNAYDGKEAVPGSVACQSYTSTNGTTCGTEPTMPNSPSLSTVAGSCPSATNFVEITYVTAAGETLPSANSSIATASNCVLVTSPKSVIKATGYNVYANTVSAISSYTLQNASPIALGSNWTEPSGGITGTGAVAPVTDTSGMGNYGDLIDYVKAANLWWLFGLQTNSAKAASPRVAIP